MTVDNLNVLPTARPASSGLDIDLAAHRSAMRGLCDYLEKSFSVLAGKSVVYFDQPVYMNIGDLAIYEGARMLLRRLNAEVINQFSVLDLGKISKDRSRFTLKTDLHRIRHNVNRADYIVFSGGGNFGDLWIDHQYMREAAISAFPSSKIIIFPQSIQFKTQEGWDRARRVMSSHRNIIFAARDHHSYEMMKNECECIQAPDTAHMIWSDQGIPRHVRSDGPMLTQSRRDAENMIGTINATQFDWDDLITPRDYASRNVSELSRRYDIGRDLLSRDWNRTSWRLTLRAISRLADSSRILTDRLHGMILATCAETPCEFSDTGYGKLTRYYEAWLKDTPLVRPID